MNITNTYNSADQWLWDSLSGNYTLRVDVSFIEAAGRVGLEVTQTQLDSRIRPGFARKICDGKAPVYAVFRPDEGGKTIAYVPLDLSEEEAIHGIHRILGE